jgi:hypothetical protein
MVKRSFGTAEFKVVCKPTKVQLIIHNNHIVAEIKEDVYNELFDYIVKKLGGRIDNMKE